MEAHRMSSVVSISPRCREVIVTEANVKDIQDTRAALLAKKKELDAESRHYGELINGLTVSLAMIQLSLRNDPNEIQTYR